MTRRATGILTAVVVCGLGASVAWCAGALQSDVLAVAIQVSPSTIVLGLDKGSSVTVHTDLPFGMVDRGTVALNGVAAASTFADSCGNLVAKFHQEDIEAIVAPPTATLALTGTTTDGTAFAGSDRVRVIVDPSPK